MSWTRLLRNLTKYRDTTLAQIEFEDLNGQPLDKLRHYLSNLDFEPEFMIGLAFGNKNCNATKSLAVTAQHAREFYDPKLPFIAQHAILANMPEMYDADWETDTMSQGQIRRDVPADSRGALLTAHTILHMPSVSFNHERVLFIAHPAHMERVLGLASKLGMRGRPFVEAFPVWNTGQELHGAGYTVSPAKWLPYEIAARMHHNLNGLM